MKKMLKKSQKKNKLNIEKENNMIWVEIQMRDLEKRRRRSKAHY